MAIKQADLLSFIRSLREHVTDLDTLKRTALKLRFKNEKFIVDAYGAGGAEWEEDITILENDALKHRRGNVKLGDIPSKEIKGGQLVALSVEKIKLVMVDMIDDSIKAIMSLPFIALKKVSDKEASKIEVQALDKENLNKIELVLHNLLTLQKIASMLQQSCEGNEYFSGMDYNGDWPKGLLKFLGGDLTASILQHFEGTLSLIGKKVNWGYGSDMERIS